MKEYPCDPSALTPGYALYLRHLFEKNGIDVAVLGNYLNLAHPDPDAVKDIAGKVLRHIRFASLLGCGMVVPRPVLPIRSTSSAPSAAVTRL